MSGIVIVGAGQAGFQLCASLRQAGFTGALTIVGEEPALPYSRPPLSKAYLAGEAARDALALRPVAFYAEHDVTALTSERVTSIDRAERLVRLQSGGIIAYDHLVLATGARNRPLLVPGANLPGVLQLRTIADADALMAEMGRARSVAIVGAGFIGLEFAAVCAAMGISVTVLEGAGRVLSRSVSAPMAAAIEVAHVSAGVIFVYDAVVSAVTGAARADGVATSDGRRFPADLVLVGIGVLPNGELATDAGLAVSSGIDVDAFLATSDPSISAIGDCVNVPSPFADGARVRIESVQNAVDGARCLAARLTGKPAPYAAVPWFWSDQGPLKLQIAGLGTPHNLAVVRGEPASGAFSTFCYRGGRLVGVESLNRAADHMIARRLLQSGASLAPEQAADPAFNLKALALNAGR
ncbi:NAD(P)/FAD-dependent oxidoreductase [Hansschlegelia quercus]|uniref:Pyridine nucleotide-disulfide oxidoreductase n=1 Tax=Hansschlegelia quercus TaxID=2528245 RepID=A0A4Q9GJP6_9HYPH|nr:FAD-dependent oxidoreductase [Hansschlegelia quercus]TBN54483.1 pyridine nucleotide-disulfide oxidoreductase [Hansschlegelia quercus]